MEPSGSNQCQMGCKRKQQMAAEKALELEAIFFTRDKPSKTVHPNKRRPPRPSKAVLCTSGRSCGHRERRDTPPCEQIRLDPHVPESGCALHVRTQTEPVCSPIGWDKQETRPGVSDFKRHKERVHVEENKHSSHAKVHSSQFEMRFADKEKRTIPKNCLSRSSLPVTEEPRVDIGAPVVTNCKGHRKRCVVPVSEEQQKKDNNSCGDILCQFPLEHINSPLKEPKSQNDKRTAEQYNFQIQEFSGSITESRPSICNTQTQLTHSKRLKGFSEGQSASVESHGVEGHVTNIIPPLSHSPTRSPLRKMAGRKEIPFNLEKDRPNPKHFSDSAIDANISDNRIKQDDREKRKSTDDPFTRYIGQQNQKDKRTPEPSSIAISRTQLDTRDGDAINNANVQCGDQKILNGIDGYTSLEEKIEMFMVKYGRRMGTKRDEEGQVRSVYSYSSFRDGSLIPSVQKPEQTGTPRSSSKTTISGNTSENINNFGVGDTTLRTHQDDDFITVVGKPTTPIEVPAAGVRPRNHLHGHGLYPTRLPIRNVTEKKGHLFNLKPDGLGRKYVSDNPPDSNIRKIKIKKESVNDSSHENNIDFDNFGNFSTDVKTLGKDALSPKTDDGKSYLDNSTLRLREKWVINEGDDTSMSTSTDYFFSKYVEQQSQNEFTTSDPSFICGMGTQREAYNAPMTRRDKVIQCDYEEREEHNKKHSSLEDEIRKCLAQYGTILFKEQCNCCCIRNQRCVDTCNRSCERPRFSSCPHLWSHVPENIVFSVKPPAVTTSEQRAEQIGSDKDIMSDNPVAPWTIDRCISTAGARRNYSLHDESSHKCTNLNGTSTSKEVQTHNYQVPNDISTQCPSPTRVPRANINRRKLKYAAHTQTIPISMSTNGNNKSDNKSEKDSTPGNTEKRTGTRLDGAESLGNDSLSFGAKRKKNRLICSEEKEVMLRRTGGKGVGKCTEDSSSKSDSKRCRKDGKTSHSGSDTQKKSQACPSPTPLPFLFANINRRKLKYAAHTQIIPISMTAKSNNKSDNKSEKDSTPGNTEESTGTYLDGMESLGNDTLSIGIKSGNNKSSGSEEKEAVLIKTGDKVAGKANEESSSKSDSKRSRKDGKPSKNTSDSVSRTPKEAQGSSKKYKDASQCDDEKNEENKENGALEENIEKCIEKYTGSKYKKKERDTREKQRFDSDYMNNLSSDFRGSRAYLQTSPCSVTCISPRMCPRLPACLSTGISSRKGFKSSPCTSPRRCHQPQPCPNTCIFTPICMCPPPEPAPQVPKPASRPPPPEPKEPDPPPPPQPEPKEPDPPPPPPEPKESDPPPPPPEPKEPDPPPPPPEPKEPDPPPPPPPEPKEPDPPPPPPPEPKEPDPPPPPPEPKEPDPPPPLPPTTATCCPAPTACFCQDRSYIPCGKSCTSSCFRHFTPPRSRLCCEISTRSSCCQSMWGLGRSSYSCSCRPKEKSAICYKKSDKLCCDTIPLSYCGGSCCCSPYRSMEQSVTRPITTEMSILKKWRLEKSSTFGCPCQGSLLCCLRHDTCRK